MEPVMSIIDEALEWRDRAEQAWQVAGELTDPGAKQAMLQAAKGYEHLARAAAAKAQKRDTNAMLASYARNSGTFSSRTPRSSTSKSRQDDPMLNYGA
jgi:hypothetical protein